MKPLVRLRDASFGYGRRPVLTGVDLEIQSGSFVGVAGPNGGGKSTLLYGILGLIPPLSGSIGLSGSVGPSGSVERFTQSLGYVPQREALDPIYPLTVLEVVHMGAYGRLRGLRTLGRRDRALAREALERVGLSDTARKSFNALSGGQRQRALIARALVMQPELLLLDEPTSGIDRAAEETILALLKELCREGMAVLLVSHALSTLRESVDALLWVDHGRVQLSDARELLAPERLEQLFVGGRSPRA